MLVLSRAPGDKTFIYLPDGRQITICIVELNRRGRRMRLGIDAPPDVRIERDDVRRHEIPEGRT